MAEGRLDPRFSPSGKLATYKLRERWLDFSSSPSAIAASATVLRAVRLPRKSLRQHVFRRKLRTVSDAREAEILSLTGLSLNLPTPGI